MIPGIIASQIIAVGEAAGVYDGAAIAGDFIDGLYRVGGVTVTAADIVDDPGAIDASGLHCDNVTEVNIIGDFLTQLLGNANAMTMILEYEELTGSGSRVPFSMQSAGFSDIFYFFCDADVGCFDQPDPGTNRQAVITSVTRPGIRRAAVLRNADELKLSVNGGTVQGETLTVADLTGLNAAYFGESGWSGALYIRRFVVFAGGTAAALPGLSAL